MMKRFVCIAGLPREVVDEIKGRPPKRFTGDATNPPIVFPVREPYSYRQGMSDRYLSELHDRLQKVPHTEDAVIMVIYVAYGEENNKIFTKDFYPFALITPIIPYYPSQVLKSERRQNLKIYLTHVIDVVDKLVERVNAIRDVLSGNNFTPLLLPLRNFCSSVVGQEIKKLYAALGTSLDPREMLENAKKMMLARHPLQRTENPRSAYFKDDRNLLFKSPGRARHGLVRSASGEHQLSCFLASRVRLGGPFNPCFHYDCHYEHRKLDPYYPNCHGIDAAPAAVTHVNIAPNDAVR